MAVTIFASPNALTPVENGFRWIIQLSDLGTLPEIKYAGYMLKDSGGGIVFEKSSMRPGATSDKIYLDFSRDIRSLMKAKLPAISAMGVQNDSTFIKEYKLVTGEITVNVETGATVDAVTTESALYKVFGGANNIFDSALITATGVHILTSRPKNYNLLRQSLDYIWVLGATTATYTVYYSDGTTQVIVQSAPYDANIVPVGLPFLVNYGLDVGYDADDVTEFSIQIGSVTYMVGFDKICDEDTDQAQSFMEVLFLEPLGGRSVMPFQIIQGAGTQGSKQEVELIKDTSTLALLRESGDQIISGKTYGTYSLKRLIGNDPDEARWLHNFGASNEHHVLLKDVGNNRFWAKFTLEGQPSINLQSKEMTVSGKLSKSIAAPYSR